MEKYKPPFDATLEMSELVISISEKIGKINSFSDLSKDPILRKVNRVKSIYSSCAIEANSLSFEQVSELINGKRVIGPQKDIIEIKNAIEAYNNIESVNPFDENDLKFIHSILVKDIISNPGAYRKCNEGVMDEKGNVIFIAPPPNRVKELMNNLFTWLNRESKNLSLLILSCIFHYEFVYIHPFSDGNGRVARFWQTCLLGNWKEIFFWLPIENQIRKYQREYYEAINTSNLEGKSNSFIVFMLKMIDQTLDELISSKNDIYNNVSLYVNKLMSVMNENKWYTSNEILELLSLKSKENFRKNYLNPAIKNGFIEMELKDKPTSKNQRYKRIK